MKLFSFLTVLLTITTLSLGCQPSSPKSDSITILVAASAGDALSEIATAFENITIGTEAPVKVRISKASSSSCARQIESGAPANIFVSANQQWVNVLDDDGLIEKHQPLASNQLVLIVPKSQPADIGKLEDLGSKNCLVALAGINVPAGIYADQALNSVKLLDVLEQRNQIIRAGDVRSALAFVERGEVDAGIVYATDAMASSAVTVVEQIDESHSGRVIYSVAMVKNNPSKHAQDFYEFLNSKPAKKILQTYGFGAL
jgi:molybdate transport system substrate-binding protein